MRELHERVIVDRIAEHLRRGELLDLAPGLALGMGVDGKATGGWDSLGSVAAEDLRELLRGRVVSDPDPRGLRLRAAHILGRLDLDNLTTTIKLTLLDCVLEEGITAEAAHLPGLSLRRCLLTHPSEPALYADELRINTSLFLEDSTVLASAPDGAIRLIGACISGELSCSGTTIRNPCGPALRADALQARAVFLDKGFTADGAGERGAVRLVGARIGGGLNCSGATLRNPCGPALGAGRLQTGGGVFLRAGFTAEGAGERAAVRLVGARVGGQFDCSTAVVESRSDPQHRWALDGLTYIGLPLHPLDEGRKGWLELFRNATPAYAAQPYQQLASAYRAAGDHHEVRAILIAQRQAQLDRGALTGRGDRMWARVTHVTLGYGYQPWRALLFLLGAVVTAVLLAVILGSHGALVHSQDPTAAITSCAITEQINVGIKVGAPLLDTQARDRCITANTVTGIVLSYSLTGLQLLTGAFAALFIAGFTGIVRKT